MNVFVGQRASGNGDVFPVGADMRVSTFPTIHGEKVVVRIFQAAAQTLDLEQLGLPADLRGALTPHKGKNQAAVKPDEIPKLLEAIGTYAQIGDR